MWSRKIERNTFIYTEPRSEMLIIKRSYQKSWGDWRILNLSYGTGYGGFGVSRLFFLFGLELLYFTAKD